MWLTVWSQSQIQKWQDTGPSLSKRRIGFRINVTKLTHDGDYVAQNEH
jgi:hypothetical protein